MDDADLRDVARSDPPTFVSAAGELWSGSEDFVDRAFDNPEQLLTSRHVPLDRASYFEALCTGGYPAVQRMVTRTR